MRAVKNLKLGILFGERMKQAHDVGRTKKVQNVVVMYTRMTNDPNKFNFKTSTGSREKDRTNLEHKITETNGEKFNAMGHVCESKHTYDKITITKR